MIGYPQHEHERGRTIREAYAERTRRLAGKLLVSLTSRGDRPDNPFTRARMTVRKRLTARPASVGERSDTRRGASQDGPAGLVGKATRRGHVTAKEARTLRTTSERSR